MKIFLSFCGIVAVIVLTAVFWTVNSFKSGQKKDFIVSNVTVSGQNIGGMTVNKAKEELAEYTDALIGRTLTVSAGREVFKTTYKDLGVTYDIDKAVETVYSYGRSGNYLKDFLAILGKGNKSVNIDVVYHKEKAQNVVRTIAEEINVEPLDATVRKSGSGVTVTQSRDGALLNEKEGLEIIEKALKNSEKQAVLNVRVIHPKIISEKLSGIDRKLGAYTTKYNPGKAARSHNLSLACGKINSEIIMPGETFSFNRTVGPRNEKTGFKNAIVFQDGQEVEGMGGGICQVSSTLFNAVLVAGLQITSRRCHTLKVHYVPLGRDAMVSYGSSDFRFRNNTETPLCIFINARGGTLNAEIWGNSSDYKNCEIERQESSDGLSANLVRYITDKNGAKVADYKTSSKYSNPKKNNDDVQ